VRRLTFISLHAAWPRCCLVFPNGLLCACVAASPSSPFQKPICIDLQEAVEACTSRTAAQKLGNRRACVSSVACWQFWQVPQLFLDFNLVMQLCCLS
jgi:hypothetical protein